MNLGTTDGLGILIDENRQQRAALVLVDVAYVIEAHFSLADKAGPEDTPAKHISMFNRRAQQGQCFHRPCLGTREFAAEFELLGPDDPLPVYDPPLTERDRDFRWMLHDIDFARGNESRFFRAQMVDSVIEAPPFHAEKVVR